MLKNTRESLDYFRLLKRAKRLEPGRGESLKLAVLGDVSTQHLLPLLRVLFADNGYAVEIYEAGYDTVQLEAYDPASGLYAFGAQAIVILQSTWKLKEIFYSGSVDRPAFSRTKAEEIENTWKAIQSRVQVPILQSNFVTPYERPFGNFDHKVPSTLSQTVLELNREISQRARRYPSVFIHDLDHLAGWVGRRSFLDEKLWAMAKALCALEFLPDVAQNIVDIVLASRGRAVKCVVLDLDNTLWGGVIGDDGLEGIGLGDLDDGGFFRSFQLYLRELGRRGIILAVCSKNDEAVARRVFREHPGMVLKEEDIAVFVANWEDKASNLQGIRQKLNIGFDTMVFVDDNSFERNLVRQLIPEIIVPEMPEDPALYVRTLASLNLFETASHSTLDEQRTALYQEQQKREVEAKKYGSLHDYLSSLQTTALLSRFQPELLGRIAQLIQRSNQFNLTTRRYSEAECEALMRDSENCVPFALSVRDRFGDFGWVSVVVLRKQSRVLIIDTFLMSCRVLQRGVEQHAMNKIVAYARAAGFERIVGHYLPTAKNGMVREFYAQFGFVSGSTSDGGGQEWTLDPHTYVPKKPLIEEQSGSAPLTDSEV